MLLKGGVGAATGGSSRGIGVARGIMVVVAVSGVIAGRGGRSVAAAMSERVKSPRQPQPD